VVHHQAHDQRKMRLLNPAQEPGGSQRYVVQPPPVGVPVGVPVVPSVAISVSVPTAVSSRQTRMHPRFQRMWYAHAHNQELMRRHLGGPGSAMAPPQPAHLSLPFPFGSPEMMVGVSGVALPPAPGLSNVALPSHNPHLRGPPVLAPIPHPHHVHHHGLLALSPLLQTVRSEEHLRMMEQRRALENHRGASRGCIERNTLPHKFRRVKRSLTDTEDEENAFDKCTICLCGNNSIPLYWC
jgi:hypothetical protein